MKIVIILLVLVALLELSKQMANLSLLKSSQYQMYLRALHSLQASGYETEKDKKQKKGSIAHYVKRGSECYGVVYVVGNPGLFYLFFGNTEIGRAINEGSTHAFFLKTCYLCKEELMRNYNVDNVGDYVSDHTDTGVGGYNFTPKGYFSTEWISILKAVKQGNSPAV